MWFKEQHFLQQIDWRKEELAVWCCFEVWDVKGGSAEEERDGLSAGEMVRSTC